MNIITVINCLGSPKSFHQFNLSLELCELSLRVIPLEDYKKTFRLSEVSHSGFYNGKVKRNWARH